MPTNLEALLYPSRAYAEIIGQYLEPFTACFGKEFMSFGYERLFKNDFYEVISNMPRIAEIFIETKTYQVMQSFTQQLCAVEHGFIYPDKYAVQPIYNHFRIELDKQLGLYATFYAMETCLNYQHVFVWNFRPPLKSISLIGWENQVLLSFINNRKSIQYVLDHFKKVYYQNISKKVVPIKLLKPILQEKKISTAKSVGESLLESKLLAKNDLYLENLSLSNKEALCAHFYLQGMSAKEIAGKMFCSRRTVEDYIQGIKQKLRVKSRSEFHAAMEKVNLWKTIL